MILSFQKKENIARHNYPRKRINRIFFAALLTLQMDIPEEMSSMTAFLSSCSGKM